MSAPIPPATRESRYAVRVTGPAGHSRYITQRGDESDNVSKAQTFQVALMAHRLADGLRLLPQGECVIDVVNLNDPEDPCHDE